MECTQAMRIFKGDFGPMAQGWGTCYRICCHKGGEVVICNDVRTSFLSSSYPQLSSFHKSLHTSLPFPLLFLPKCLLKTRTAICRAVPSNQLPYGIKKTSLTTTTIARNTNPISTNGNGSRLCRSHSR